MKIPALSLAVLLAAASGTGAQEASGAMDHGKTDHGATGMNAAAADAPSSKAYMAAMTAMQRDMGMDLTGDADLDFLKGMIPHHRGAIAMAKVELQYGKDPKLKALAERIVAAQAAEIDEMQRWIADRQR